MGIPEYWIVDYLALGARKFIGDPKNRLFQYINLLNFGVVM
jgi:Uma2 family endonuclease